MSSKAVVLIGLSGAGKSSVAKILQDKHQKKVEDIDQKISRLQGKPVEEIIRVEGESVFRRLESEAIKSSLDADVIALGAGALTVKANVALLSSEKLIWLKVGVAEALKRISSSEEVRPLIADLSASERLVKLQKMLNGRAKEYARANTVVHTDWVSPEDVAELLLEDLPKCTVHPSYFKGARSDVYVGSGIRKDFGRMVSKQFPGAKKLALVSDTNVSNHWLEEVRQSFLDFEVHPLIVEAGEQSKRLSEVERLAELMVKEGFTRNDLVVGLGGGVVGDISGLLASLYMRGIGLVHIPTTVVAQVDSAVGGKTGVDLEGGKNLVGTFHPARMILVDIGFLSTLPDREFRSGMGEVIKYGAIASEEFFQWLSDNAELVMQRSDEELLKMVNEGVRIKLESVAADPLDVTGKRASLNFGHTLGHALEKLLNYEGMLHGEAVAIGMLFASRLGERLGITPSGLSQEVSQVLSKYALPKSIPTELLKDELAEAWIIAMLADKKRVGTELSFVLLPKLGRTELREVSKNKVLEELSEQ